MLRRCSRSLLIPWLLSAATLLSSPTLLAWGSVGHRLTAAVALHFIDDDTAAELIAILEQHPRFQEDFLNEMPQSVFDGDEQLRNQWLLGQAAYWPDIARNIEESVRDQFNRPWWHYTDGAWLRGSAVVQGNNYTGIDSFPDVQGEAASSIIREEDVGNVVTGIDYNTAVLANPDRPMSERAVALCWVLHLMGDLHQPLHTGSMYSQHVFERGDLGGNRINLDLGNNLHARWDSALYSDGLEASLPILISKVSGFTAPRIQGVESDWNAWMAESRQILNSWVYTPEIIAAIETADREQADYIRPQTLSPEYVERMKDTAQQRLGLAGLRLAIWFENEMP